MSVGRGAHWRELPERYPPYQTCHRRFQQWIRSGRLEEALKLLAAFLHGQGKLDLDEAFVDATFASAKKWGLAVGPTRPGKGTKIIAVAADHSPSPGSPASKLAGVALAVSVQSASPAECTLVEAVLAGSFLDELPVRLIGDKAYDLDGLDNKLAVEYGIELIAPNRRNRRKTQGGRPLRRYKRR